VTRITPARQGFVKVLRQRVFPAMPQASAILKSLKVELLDRS
jgi:hypothetical protein